MLCEHLAPLERALQTAGIPETYRGQVWTQACREWAYFACRLDVEQAIAFCPDSHPLRSHRNDDSRSGLEAGLYCTQCKDAIMGIHPDVKGAYPHFPARIL